LKILKNLEKNSRKMQEKNSEKYGVFGKNPGANSQSGYFFGPYHGTHTEKPCKTPAWHIQLQSFALFKSGLGARL